MMKTQGIWSFSSVKKSLPENSGRLSLPTFLKMRKAVTQENRGGSEMQTVSVVLLFLGIIPTIAFGEMISDYPEISELRSSRYIVERPIEHTSNPLDMRVSRPFPAKIENLLQAIDDVLWGTGYAPIYTQETEALYRRLPIPFINRDLTKMTATVALGSLIGHDAEVNIDHQLRLIEIKQIKQLTISQVNRAVEAHDTMLARSSHFLLKSNFQEIEYRVKKGDSISAILMAYGVPKASLKTKIDDAVNRNPDAFVNADPNQLHANVLIRLLLEGAG